MYVCMRALVRTIAERPVPLGGHTVVGTHYIHGIVEKLKDAVAMPNTRHITSAVCSTEEELR